VQAAPQIFLSYAWEDKEKVEKLYQKLSNVGFKPWMDKKDILPGERWQSSIRKAIRCSDFFLACLSANSVSKRGFLQKEVRQALDMWQEKLEEDIYLIPIRLEDCEVPEGLRGFHWVNLFEEDGWTRLVKAIQVGMERRMEVTADEESSPSTEMAVPEEGPERVPDAEKIAKRSSRPDHAEQLPLLPAVLGSVSGFLVGVLGNLVAGWIQQDLLGNAFTLPWIVVILLLTAAGLGAGVWMQHSQLLGTKLKAVIVIAFVLATLIAIVSSLTNGMGANGTNHPPDIQSIVASPSTLIVGQEATLTVIATDVDGDNLVYYWEAQKGTVPSGAQDDTITYTASARSGLDTIKVAVTDGDATTRGEIKLSVLAADASGQ
jgi:hypothetical protein